LEAWKAETERRAGREEEERIRLLLFRDHVMRHLGMGEPANGNRGGNAPEAMPPMPQGSAPPQPPIRDAGMSLALTLRNSYRDGLSLWLPGDRDWLLKPEQFMHADVSVGTFDQPMPLAVVGARDPAPVMALAASARLVQQARVNRTSAEVCREVREATIHESVRRTVYAAEQNGFSIRAVDAVRRSVSAEINAIRTQCFDTLKANFSALLEGELDPLPFVNSFFALCELSHVRADVYQKLILTLLLSAKVRPAAKMLVLQRFERIPRAIQLNIVRAVAYAKRDVSNDYVKEELHWMVQRNPEILRAPQ